MNTPPKQVFTEKWNATEINKNLVKLKSKQAMKAPLELL